MGHEHCWLRVEYLNSLVDMYGRCGAMSKAEKVFADLCQRGIADVVSFSIMIGSYARAGDVSNAMRVLEDGTKLKLRWTDQTFCSLLVACGEMCLLSTGESVHGIASRVGCCGVEYYTSLLYMYGRCGELKRAEEIHSDLCDRGMVTCQSLNCLLNGNEGLV